MTTDTKKTVVEDSGGRQASKSDVEKTLADYAKELEAMQAYTKALADQLKASDASTFANQDKAWEDLMEKVNSISEQVKALAAKADVKMQAGQAWEALDQHTKTINEQARGLGAAQSENENAASLYARALGGYRALLSVDRKARAFGDGFCGALSPSFYLRLDNDDYERQHSIKHSSLREIWEQVGQHIDDAASVAVASKHGRRAKGREE